LQPLQQLTFGGNVDTVISRLGGFVRSDGFDPLGCSFFAGILALKLRTSNDWPMNASEIDLTRMTVAEKLQLMEALWEDLARNEGQIASPDWHQQVLEDRERKIASGEESFVDWDAAKRKLRDQLG
jgi:hypothetical protein